MRKPKVVLLRSSSLPSAASNTAVQVYSAGHSVFHGAASGTWAAKAVSVALCSCCQTTAPAPERSSTRTRASAGAPSRVSSMQAEWVVGVVT